MARSKQVWLTIFFIVLEFSKPSVQYDGYSKLQAKCSDMLDKIHLCWVDHSDIPTCGDDDNDDPLVKCAKEAKENIKRCNQEIKDQVHQMFKAIKTLRAVLCEDTDLKEEFSNKITCWHTARACSVKLAMMSADDDDADDDSNEDESNESNEKDECTELLDQVEKCNQISTGCTEIQSNFTYDIFEKSSCAAHAEKLMAGADSEGNNAHHTLSSFVTIVVVTTLLAATNW